MVCIIPTLISYSFGRYTVCITQCVLHTPRLFQFQPVHTETAPSPAEVAAIHTQQLLQKIQENLHSLKSCCKKIHKSTKIQKIPIRAQQLLQKKSMEIQKSRITESQLLLLHITTKVTELVSTQVILLEFYSIAIWWISNIFHCCKRKPVEFVTSVGLSNLVELNNFVQICEREPVELVSRVGSCSKMASYLSLSSHLVARTCFQNRLLQYLYS